MRIPRVSTVLLGLCLFVGSACGPIGPLSGGRLSGDVGPADVADWSFSDAHETVQLETQPSDPHSVNIWCAAVGPSLYVPSSLILGPKVPSERDWVAQVVADPAVRIRIDGTVYERTAVRVDDATEFESARATLEEKYDLAAEERDPEREVWIFRLDPRT